jgi:hypothetical protein
VGWLAEGGGGLGWRRGKRWLDRDDVKCVMVGRRGGGINDWSLQRSLMKTTGISKGWRIGSVIGVEVRGKGTEGDGRGRKGT